MHSFDSIEYVFEPPMLIALFSAINSLPEADWNFLYQAYVYEEFLVSAVSGRAINTNRADDSSIYAVKLERDIAERIDRSLPRSEAGSIATSRRVAYKIPNIVPFIPKLQARFPRTTILLMARGALETIHSLLAKHVFKSGHPSAALPWPTRVIDGNRVPYWLKPGDERLWTELTEIDRCAYYYIRMNEGLHTLEKKIVVRYSDLLASPKEVASRLAQRLDVKFGALTSAVIDSIKKPPGRQLDASLINSISDLFRASVLDYSARAE